MNLRRGDVVLVGFPFTDLTATKVRPALVVSPPAYHRATGDALLAAISSVAPARARPTAIAVRDRDAGFRASGLRRTSWILCGKLFTVEQRLLLRRLGRVDSACRAQVDRALSAALGLRPWR